ncbi:hypothetical protein LTR37_015393 [Vermiconidia calcicola]|uniref:Uncharacterized protein n=1 Tax=Vermiconidia calcicola TaxID=1690605 RepID=A0ACC3MSG0_9PEZI|nr:hypothetical protein LTR37_015393 [Vermiconidia calcicola]
MKAVHAGAESADELPRINGTNLRQKPLDRPATFLTSPTTSYFLLQQRPTQTTSSFTSLRSLDKSNRRARDISYQAHPNKHILLTSTVAYLHNLLPLRAAHPRPTHSVKIASRPKHQHRTSLLGGSGSDKKSASYQPLSGATSLASARDYTPHEHYEAGGYFDRQGLGQTAAIVRGNKTSKMYMPSTLWTWAFFLVALLQAIVSLTIEAYVFGEFQSSLKGAALGPNPPSGALTIPTYLAIFIFGFVYQMVLVWDALRLKNTIQVIGICIYNLGMMVYAAVEMDQVKDAVRQLGDGVNIDSGTWTYLEPCLIAAPCVIALGTVLLSIIAWKLYQEFAWTIYKHISADLRLKRRYLTYQVRKDSTPHLSRIHILLTTWMNQQIYIALLKFDFFFFLGFTVQFLVIVAAGGETYEFALTIAALPITIALLFLAAYLVRRESYLGQAFIIVLYFAGMAYFIFKLIRMYDGSALSVEYVPARRPLTTFAVLTLLLLVGTIATAGVCMRNFGKGLRPHIQTRKVPDVDEGKYVAQADPYYPSAQQHQLGAVPSRMTID